MTKILRIQTGANLEQSLTRQIGDALVARLSGEVVIRDLVARPLPHVETAFVRSVFTDHDDPALTLSDELIAELFDADAIVIESPMYNFSISSTLKAWIDHVVRARKTFRITATGVEGMLVGKKVYLVLGRGAVYSDGPFKPMTSRSRTSWRCSGSLA